MESPFSPPAVFQPTAAVSDVFAGYTTHLLEVSPRQSTAITAAAYAGLRGRTVPADFLCPPLPQGVSTDWAAEVKGGNVFWLHYDGLVEELQDKTHLQYFGKWVRWQQRRGLYWSLALPRRSSWLTTPVVVGLAILPAARRVMGHQFCDHHKRPVA